MKKLFVLTLAALMVGSTAVYAQDATRQSIKERKLEAKAAKSALNEKATKAARKEGKSLTKQGWVVAPGHIPLEKQLDKSYQMYYEYDESGLPKWIIGDAMSPGKTYDAAKVQALDLARNNLAGMIQSEIAALVESTVGNEQMSQTDGESIVKTVMASKSLIAQKLGRTVPVIECYRTTKDKAVEVRVTVAYNSKMAIDYAKSVIKQKLEEEGKDLHEQLDALNIEY